MGVLGTGNVRAQENEQISIREQMRKEERNQAERQYQADLERRRKEAAIEENRIRNARTSYWSRDPILFGMIEGSRRLYFVADWVTDDDDLTLEKLNLVVENATQWLEAYTHDTEEEHRHIWQALENIMTELQPVSAESTKD